MAGYYDILEIKKAPSSGYHTPAQARSYYGGYSRDGVIWHWWNSPSNVKDSDHDNIVNYIMSKARNGTGSINYVLSNKKITYMVSPDNVSWHVSKKTAPFPNAHYIGVELSPHLNAEGYKKAGWLFNELEGRYKKTLKHSKHNDWISTQCPGTIDVNRIKTEAKKWKDGKYNDTPAPAPTPPKTYTEAQYNALNSKLTAANSQINSKTAQIALLEAQVDELNKAIKIKDNEITKLKAQSGDSDLTITQAIKVLIQAIKESWK